MMVRNRETEEREGRSHKDREALELAKRALLGTGEPSVLLPACRAQNENERLKAGDQADQPEPKVWLVP